MLVYLDRVALLVVAAEFSQQEVIARVLLLSFCVDLMLMGFAPAFYSIWQKMYCCLG